MGLACPSGLSPSPSRAPRPRSSASRQGKAPSRHHLLQPVICECSLSWVQVTPSPCMNAGPPSTGSHFFLFRRRCGSSCHISVPPREVPTSHAIPTRPHSFIRSFIPPVCVEHQALARPYWMCWRHSKTDRRPVHVVEGPTHMCRRRALQERAASANALG